MRWKALCAAAAMAAVCVTPASANDSSAELVAGGLVLKTSDAIAMVSEDLYISTKQVRVRYVFQNVSDKDVTTEVAFPLPEIPPGIEVPMDIPNPASDNFVNFVTRVDGRPVKLSVTHRATLNGADVTARLVALGVPLSPRHPGLSAAVLKLPADVRAQLEKDGLVTREDYNAGPGWEVGYTANWATQSTFHRTQTFPAKKRVVVDHFYQPVAGGSVGSLFSLQNAEANFKDELAEMTRKYCVDETFRAGVAAQMKGVTNGMMPERTVGYVLKTGANWAGPIQDFRLVVDKGKPKALVSFCGEGVKQISATRYEMRKTNFTPDRDLAILILDPVATY